MEVLFCNIWKIASAEKLFSNYVNEPIALSYGNKFY